MIPTRARVTKCLTEDLEGRCQDDRCPVKMAIKFSCFDPEKCLTCTDSCTIKRIVQNEPLTMSDYLQGAVVIGGDGQAYRVGDIVDSGKAWALHRYYRCDEYEPYPTRYKYFTCSDDFELWWR